jgi:hypothetical protein
MTQIAFGTISARLLNVFQQELDQEDTAMLEKRTMERVRRGRREGNSASIQAARKAARTGAANA